MHICNMERERERERDTYIYIEREREAERERERDAWRLRAPQSPNPLAKSARFLKLANIGIESEG